MGQDEVDPNFYIWAWRWWVYAVTHGINPLYSYQIRAPAGYNLAWATTSPSVALLMWPITATLGPVVSFNLTLLLAPPASAWAAFVAARRLTGRFWASLPAGVVFGFNVYTLDHEMSGQPNLTVTLLLPLMAYLVMLWWDRTPAADRLLDLDDGRHRPGVLHLRRGLRRDDPDVGVRPAHRASAGGPGQLAAA